MSTGSEAATEPLAYDHPSYSTTSRCGLNGHTAAPTHRPRNHAVPPVARPCACTVAFDVWIKTVSLIRMLALWCRGNDDTLTVVMAPRARKDAVQGSKLVKMCVNVALLLLCLHFAPLVDGPSIGDQGAWQGPEDCWRSSPESGCTARTCRSWACTHGATHSPPAFSPGSC